MSNGQPLPPVQNRQTIREAPGATAGLVLGICSIVVGFPIIGLVLGFIGLQKSKQAQELCAVDPTYTNAGVAQAGFICSIIGLVFGGFTTLCGCGYFIIVIVAIAGAAASAGAG